VDTAFPTLSKYTSKKLLSATPKVLEKNTSNSICWLLFSKLVTHAASVSSVFQYTKSMVQLRERGREGGGRKKEGRKEGRKEAWSRTEPEINLGSLSLCSWPHTSDLDIS
jgi:hypothetical protein